MIMWGTWGLTLVVLVLLITLVYASKRPRITFYTAKEARALFQNSVVKTMVASYRTAECLARSSTRADGPKAMQLEYCRAARDFKPREKARINAIIQSTEELRGLTWKFVKMADYMDFHLPYTVEDVVVLPEDSMTHDRTVLATTLLHESQHIMQRANQAKFDRYYIEHWGYKQPKRLLIPERIRKDLVTNPDGLDINWVRNINGTYWWTALVLEEGNPAALAFRCKQIGPSTFRVIGSSHPFASLKRYYFGETDAYHPNELYATLHSKDIRCSTGTRAVCSWIP